MTQNTALRPITPEYDPWEAYMDVDQYGDMKLTNVEFTTTTLCNMRCEHCAVGYTLQPKDPNALPIDLLLKRLMKFLCCALSALRAANRCFR